MDLKKVIYILFAAITLSALSACGKKGPPIPDEASPYPRTYPKEQEKEIH